MTELDEPTHYPQDGPDVNKIMQVFGLTSWNNLGPVDTYHQDIWAHLVEVSGQRYIVRERPVGPQGEDPLFRYQFQSFMQQSGIPVAPFLVAASGEPLVQVGEDYFELQRQIDGEMFSTGHPRSLDWVTAAGSMLARLHQASQRYAGPPHRWPGEAHIGAMVQSYLNLARMRAGESHVQAVSSALSQWADQWEKILPSAMVAVGSGHALPELHIHGDYHPLNLRFDAAGVHVVTGFEAVRWEKRLFEVAYSLIYFSALSWLPGSDDTPPLTRRGFDPERVHAFLQGYRDIYPLTTDEAALLTDALLLVAPLATANGPLDALFYMREDTWSSTLIDDMMERLSWAIALPAWLKRVRTSFSDM